MSLHCRTIPAQSRWQKGTLDVCCNGIEVWIKSRTITIFRTRAGKGQTYIEPVIDMWTRERRANNMVINDPKGELLVKFYVRGTMRGFQIVQFNLINAAKTDIYNRAPRFVMKSCNVAC